MKISYNWLTKYLYSELTANQICEILTDIGLEVENCDELYSPLLTKKDYLLEVNITPNRSYALSHFGIARDIYAALKVRKYKVEIHRPDIKNFKSEKSVLCFPISIKSPEHCIRYSGCFIKGVRISPSPTWLQKRLQSIQLNPINNVVDVTNFVLNEIGQPIHVFDSDNIKGEKIYIKTLSNNGIPFQTVDKRKYILHEEDLMICDTHRPLFLAGILGSIHSSVTDKTQNIFLESACFNPMNIRKSVKRHAVNTDASFRVERGTDPEQVLYALKRAALLIQEIAGGRISEPIDLYPKPVKCLTIELRYETINRILGETLRKNEVKKILYLLDLNILSENKKMLRVSVPPYRIDVQNECDIIEEILRMYGYNRVKTSGTFCFSLKVEKKIPNYETTKEKISTFLNAQGFYEVINLSLTHSKYKQFFRSESFKDIELLNPLSEDCSLLRQSLLFGLLERVSHNINHRNTFLKLFEWGKIYGKKPDKYIENERLSLVISVKQNKKHWLHSKEFFSFFALKGIVEALLKISGVPHFEQILTEDNLLGKSILFTYKQYDLVRLGCVKKSIIEHFDIKQEVFYAEIYWEYLIKIFKVNRIVFKKLPKYPGVRRDLSILINRNISFEELYQESKKTEKKLLKEVHLFDVYEGEKLPKGKKSYALSFYFEDQERTLTVDRINHVMDNIRHALKKSLDAEFR